MIINLLKDKVKRFSDSQQRVVMKIYKSYLQNLSRLKWLPRNIMSDLYFLLLKDKKNIDINLFEKKVYSQNGEDGILRYIFYKIGTTNKFCVEFGVEDGSECNSTYFIRRFNWNFLHMDPQEYLPKKKFIKEVFVTPKNVNTLFKKYEVPKEFDLLSIDVDYDDYWIWKAIKGYSPRVVVVEYNSHIPLFESKVINPDPAIKDKYPLDCTRGGASLSALVKLGKSKGYTLVACNSTGINAFFVRSDLVIDNFSIKSIEDIYNPPGYSFYQNGKKVDYKINQKVFIEV